MNFQSWTHKCVSYLKTRNGTLALLITTAVILMLFSLFSKKENPKIVVEENLWTTDTVIPKGYSLLPIEIQNHESLSSLMGSFGLVDLFTYTKIYGQKGVRVASQVKMIRAPNNANQYAILVPAERASEILAFPGPFVVALQNPQSKSQTHIKNTQRNAPTIEYFNSARSSK